VTPDESEESAAPEEGEPETVQRTPPDTGGD
jgi:hypothetical protein